MIFHTVGEQGWSPDIKSTISFPEYLCSRLLMCDEYSDGSLLTWQFEAGRGVTVNRFQLMSRSMHTYAVGTHKYTTIASITTPI